MGCLRDVQEHAELVAGEHAAHVALERVAVAVVAHVDGVHHRIGEGHVAKLAHVRLGPVEATRRLSTAACVAGRAVFCGLACSRGYQAGLGQAALT